MTLSVAIRNMTSNDNDFITPEAIPTSSDAGLDIEALSPRQLRVVLVCDVVESVRWMEQDEDNAITRWSQFAAAVRSRIAPEHAGSVVKSTGDGLMLEFESAPQAVAAANAMQKLCSEGNAGFDAERQMHLRIGIHQAQVRRDAHDLYGHGVNLAARISTLAGPGEIIVTPEVRDHLTDSLDGDIEDMGECYLKHLSEPQRVYRVGDMGQKPLLTKIDDYGLALKPTLAVIPFETGAGLSEQKVIGDLLADGVIARLVRSDTLRVLSRFSTLALRGERYAEADFKTLLGADYVLRGNFAALGNSLTIGYELSSTKDHVLVMANRYTGAIADLFNADNETCGSIAVDVINSIIDEQLKSSLTKPLPTLASYSLYLMGVAGIHRSMPKENEVGEAALRHLMERHPKAAEPAIWLSQWLAIQVSRGLTSDREVAMRQAKTLIQHALDREPNNSFALSILGLMDSFFARNFTNAENMFNQALALNPNQAFAWLYKATLLAWTDRGKEGTEAAEKALALTPLHPLRYYMESLAAVPYLVARDYTTAISLCKSSLKANKMHSSSYRMLAAALALSGQQAEARDCIAQLIALEPNITAGELIKRYPGRDSSFASDLRSAYLDAGLSI